MKSVKLTVIYLMILPAILSSCNEAEEKDLVTVYPAIPDVPESDLYELAVNDREIWVDKIRTSMDIETLPDWFTDRPYTRVQQEVHIANFSVGGPVEIQLKLKEPFEEITIMPRSRAIEPVINGQEVTFNIPGPDKLYIQVDSLPQLCLFANPVETGKPDASDTSILYFGPGVHRPGIMTLKDNQSVYIAGGALVYGGIRASNVSNIKVFGRGILDGDFTHQRMVLIEQCENVTFEGITIRNGRGWTNTLVDCDNVVYQDVKVISFGPSGDGINPLGSRDVTINECFLRCTDDCIAIKSPDSALSVRNIKVTNNTMIGYAFSDGITIGFETNGPEISDVHVKNCDILMARGGSRVDGHSAFSIICDGPARIHDILYEDIRVEEPVLKLFELHITDGTKYGINPPGHIENIHLRNITWASKRPVILQGFDEDHMVRNVTFENCTIEGEPLYEINPDIFRVGDHVEGIHFN